MGLRTSGKNTRKKNRTGNLILATWNVRTLLDTKSSKRPNRQTAIVAQELLKYKIDIAALQETRFEGTGELRESSHTFFWSGKSPGQRRDAGVGFAIANDLVRKMTCLPTPGTIPERIIKLRIPLTRSRFCSLVCAYAPTMVSSEAERLEFYHQLEATLAGIAKSDKLIVLGDFNARVGSDHSTWSPVLGPFGRGRSNANGELLLSKCAEHDLVITNTHFQVPDQWFHTWQHPRSKRWHTLDYVIARRRDRADIRSTRVMRGANCSTDHLLVRTICKFSIEPQHRRQRSVAPKKLNTDRLKDQEIRTEFTAVLDARLADYQPTADVEQTWKNFRDPVHKTCEEILGRPVRKHADWFDSNDSEIRRLLDERNQLRCTVMNDRCTRSVLSQYKASKANVQCELRRMENQWWSDKAAEMQSHADSNNMEAFYKSLKQVYGPNSSGCSPLLSKDGTRLITDKPGILDRMKEHVSDLLNKPPSFSTDALQGIKQRPVDDKLGLPPSMEEIRVAIKETKLKKAPGQDGIPPEAYRYGGEAFVLALHHIFITCWENRELPHDYKDAIIVMLYKRKGEKKDCGNFRGISLLSIAGKILAKIMQKRLQKLAEEVLPESQCGFRPGRSTIDMIFTLRQLQEKCVEQNEQLVAVFVDFAKAFDTVDRQLLWDLLLRYGCPPTFVEVVKAFHTDMHAIVKLGGEESGSFPITAGVKQGCVLAPLLFSLLLGAMLSTMGQGLEEGVYIKTRSDGGLYNLRRLKSKSKVRELCVRELLFADDSALVTHSHTDAQKIITRFAEVSRKFGLTINIKKTEVLVQPTPGRTATDEGIQIGDQDLNSVSQFTYLGSTVSNDNTIDAEIDKRIQAACRSFGMLKDRLWKRKGISLDTKFRVYRAVVITTLLYSAETYTVYRRHLSRLNAVQLRHLRSIMDIGWQDRVSNTDVLRRAKMPSVEAILAGSQLRWVGHVLRMSDSRLPKAVFYGELSVGQRHACGPKLRYKDVIKRHLETANVAHTQIESLASDRKKWQAIVEELVVRTDEARAEREASRQDARRPTTEAEAITHCHICRRPFRAHIGLHSHLRAHERRGET